MAKITVFTVILGGYDNLRAPQVIEPEVDYICISDEPHNCFPWKIWPAYMPYKEQSRNSRIPKILSDLYFPSEFSIYVDACFKLQAPASAIIQMIPEDKDALFYRHPCRTNIFQEIAVCEKEHIGDGPEMMAQVERYRSIPGIEYGLWSGGFIVRKNNPRVTEFNRVWWREYSSGCMRDQIALPAAIRKTNLDIVTRDAEILQDPKILGFCYHADFKHLADNPSFEESRKARREQFEKLRSLCQINP
jgi:hypothetical protein